MQEQIDGNPFFHFEKRADFVQYRMHEHNKARSPRLRPCLTPPRLIDKDWCCPHGSTRIKGSELLNSTPSPL